LDEDKESARKWKASDPNAPPWPLVTTVVSFDGQTSSSDEIEIPIRGQTAYCVCNGEVLETAMNVPATGPIGLEGDRGQMEYRRIRIRESP